jgi:hypothetical protein
MLLLALPILGVPYERTEEYAQKQAILNERAARFKAETGFEGSISYNHQYMRFSNLTGNFQDINVTAPQDSVSMRQVFDQVRVKVMSYILAKDDQLYRGKVVCNVLGAHVIYRQMVNGYRIEEGIGSLRISYNIATGKLSILDDTADISSEIVPVNITMEQAIHLAQDEVLNGADAKPYNPRIAYTLGDNKCDNQFYLCYVLDFRGYTVCIDVSNSTIRRITPSMISRSIEVNVLGECR